jgi:hypothetical protein
MWNLVHNTRSWFSFHFFFFAFENVFLREEIIVRHDDAKLKKIFHLENTYSC